MSRKLTQPDRLSVEYAQSMRSQMPVVEGRYRLQTPDLAGPLEVVVRAVSTQGIEALIPVLHSDTLPKPLALDATNVQRMTRIAGSPLIADWVGQTVVLRVVEEGGRQRIRLYTPRAHATISMRQATIRPGFSAGYRTAFLLVFALVLALTAIYILEHWVTIAGFLFRS